MNKELPYRIEEFDIQKANDELWEKVLNLMENEFIEEFPSYPIPNRILTKKEMSMNNPYRLRKRWLLFSENDELIGLASASYQTPESPEYETNKHVAYVNIIVDKESRKHGFGTILFDELIQDATKRNISAMDFWTSHPSGIEACKSWGTSLLHKHYVNRLMIKDVNWDLITEWDEEVQVKAPEVSFEFFNEIPENDVKQFVDLYTETINQAPWGSDTEDRISVESRRFQENDYKEKGFTGTTLCSREANGEISGITEIIYKPEEPDFMQQDLTGVRDVYRKRGIGKALKAKMLLFIREKYPQVEYMTTGNALGNNAVLSINRRMGYKETNVFHLYRFELKEQKLSQ